MGVAVLNGLLYAVGGYDGVARQCLNSVECYNPDADEWVCVEPMTQRRSGAAVTVLDGMLYAVGGHNGPDIRKSLERYVWCVCVCVCACVCTVPSISFRGAGRGICPFAPPFPLCCY